MNNKNSLLERADKWLEWNEHLNSTQPGDFYRIIRDMRDYIAGNQRALIAIAEGGFTKVYDDRYITVENPKFQEDNGEPCYLVIDSKPGNNDGR